MLPFTLLWLKKTPVHKQDMVNLLLLGFLNQLNLILIFWGLKYTTATDYAVLTIMGPLLSIVAGHHFFKEKVNNWVKFGVFIATLGTLYVAFEPLFENGRLFSNNNIDLVQRLFGNILIFFAHLVFTAYIIWSKATTGDKSAVLNQTLKYINIKPMKTSYSSQLITALNFYIGFAILIPFTLAETFGKFGNYTFDINSLSLVPVLGILYMAVFSSIVAYLMFQWALANSQVEDNAIFSYLQPVFAIPFAFLLLHEIPTQTTVIGVIIIAIGVVIAEAKKT